MSRRRHPLPLARCGFRSRCVPGEGQIARRLSPRYAASRWKMSCPTRVDFQDLLAIDSRGVRQQPGSRDLVSHGVVMARPRRHGMIFCPANDKAERKRSVRAAEVAEPEEGIRPSSQVTHRGHVATTQIPGRILFDVQPRVQLLTQVPVS